MFELLAHTNEVVDEGFFDQMMGGGNWSGDRGVAIFWMFIVMIGIIVGVIYLLAYFGKDNKQSKNDDPLALAKSRYAKGEINKKQFDEIKKNIS